MIAANVVVLLALVAFLLRLEIRDRNQRTKGTIMSKQLDDLTAQVAANTAVEASALTLIIAAAGTDPAKLDALRTELETSAQALAAAVAANTPAAPPAPAPAPAG